MNTNNQALLAISTLTATKTLQINVVDANNSTNSNNASKIHALLIALLFIISMILVPWGKVYAVTPAPIKWHPGHYYTIMSSGKNDPYYLAKVYSELDATPALRGVQIRYEWAELEKSQGVYDFTSIDKRLAELASRGKRLVILLQLKSFDLNAALIPSYLKTSTYEGGVFVYNAQNKDLQGYHIKFWNSQLRDRMAALVKALGQRFNSHEYFEGIGLTETAMGTPVDPLSTANINGYYNNLLYINKQMRNSFPNTMTFQFTNYPRPILGSFISSLESMGTGLGGPDTFPEEPGLLYQGTPKGVYNYYSDYAGKIPMTPSVMPDNYLNVRGDGTSYQPTVSELLAFARDRLKANYIFWTRDKNYYQKVLEMLNWSEQTSNPSGGLNAACPTTYLSCIE